MDFTLVRGKKKKKVKVKRKRGIRKKEAKFRYFKDNWPKRNISCASPNSKGGIAIIPTPVRCDRRSRKK